MASVLQQFVVTPEMRSDESLPHYLQRLARANALDSAARLPVAHDMVPVPATTPAAHRIAMCPQALEALEGMLGNSKGRLQGEAWRLMESTAGHYVRLQGASLPLEAMMTTYAQVCGACLQEEPYARADWDLAHVTTCARHQVLLVDTCLHCNGRLKSSRPVVTHCGACHSDLRATPQLRCTPEEARLGDVAAALASFRFVGLTESIQPPEILFELVRLLATPRQLLLDGRRIKGWSNLALLDRHRGVQRLALCLDGMRVAGKLVHREFAAWYQHWVAFAGLRARSERIYRWLQGNDHLDDEMCRYLAFEGQQADIAPAYVHHRGRPPRLFRRAQVQEYLGCSPGELADLEQAGLIVRPRRGFAYDADQLGACRRILASHLSPSQVDTLVDVVGVAEGLLTRGVVHSTRRAALSPLIAATDLGAMADRLLERTSSTAGGSRLRKLDEVVGAPPSGELLANVISCLLRGHFSSFDWLPPYTWRSMKLPLEELLQVTRHGHF